MNESKKTHPDPAPPEPPPHEGSDDKSPFMPMLSAHFRLIQNAISGMYATLDGEIGYLCPHDVPWGECKKVCPRCGHTCGDHVPLEIDDDDEHIALCTTCEGVCVVRSSAFTEREHSPHAEHEHDERTTNEMRTTLDSFMEFMLLVRDTPLGDIMLETVAAAQEHHTVTARVGVNTDGTVSVFCKDPKKAALMTKAISIAKEWHPVSVPPLELTQVRLLLEQPGVLEAFTGESKPQAPGWNPAMARVYLRNLSEMLVSSPKLLALRDRLDGDDGLGDGESCIESEGRFRAVLHDTLQWSVLELNEAVEQVREGRLSPRFSTSTLVALAKDAESYEQSLS